MLSKLTITKHENKLVISVSRNFEIEGLTGILSWLNQGIIQKPNEVAYLIFISSSYLIIFYSIWLIVQATTLPTVLSAIGIASCLLVMFGYNALAINATSKLEIDRQKYKIWLKVHWLSWTVKGEVENIQDIKLVTTRVTSENGKLAQMCVLKTKRGMSFVTRALNVEDAKLIKHEIIGFINS